MVHRKMILDGYETTTLVEARKKDYGWYCIISEVHLKHHLIPVSLLYKSFSVGSQSLNTLADADGQRWIEKDGIICII
jgi:hypothetical protein